MEDRPYELVELPSSGKRDDNEVRPPTTANSKAEDEDYRYEQVELSHKRNRDHKEAAANIPAANTRYNNEDKHKILTKKSYVVTLVALVATFAILILAVIVLMVLVIRNIQTSGSNTEIESLKRQVEDLKTAMLHCQQFNNASLLDLQMKIASQERTLSSLHNQFNKSLEERVNYELQLQANTSRQIASQERTLSSLHNQFNKSLESLNYELQLQANTSRQIASQERTLSSLHNQFNKSLNSLQERVNYELQLQANMSRQANHQLETQVQQSLKAIEEQGQHELEQQANKSRQANRELESVFQQSLKALEEQGQYELELLANKSRLANQELEMNVQRSEEEIGNHSYFIQALYSVLDKNVSQRFEQLEFQLHNSSAAALLSAERLSGRVNELAGDIQTVRSEVQTNNTEIYLKLEDFGERMEQLETEFLVKLNATETKLESQLDTLWENFTSRTETLNESLTLHLSTLESQVTLTQTDVKQYKAELKEFVEMNVSAPISMEIYQLMARVNGSSEDIEHLNLRLNESTNEFQSEIDAFKIRLGQLPIEELWSAINGTEHKLEAQSIALNKKIDSRTKTLNETVLQQFSRVEIELNLTRMYQKRTESNIVEFVLENVSTPVALEIDALVSELNNTAADIHALQLLVNQSTTAAQMNISDLVRRINNLSFENIALQNVSERALVCEGLSPPDDGVISVAPGPNSLSHGLGSVATYSCHPGYALVGQTTRTCEDTKGGTVTTGTWSGTPPSCQAFLCLELTAPAHGEVTLSSKQLAVGTTATYSCDPGYALVGQTTRTCEDTNGGTVTTGTWSGTPPSCQSTVLLDCSTSICNSEQLMCPELLLDNCTVQCHNSLSFPYACSETEVTCPSRGGDCSLNCDDSHACQQTTMICPQGNCQTNCDYSYSCQYLTASCSGESCLINCEEDNTCQHSVVECESGNCEMNCGGGYSCHYSTALCASGEECNIYCHGDDACRDSDFMCPVGGNCSFHFEGLYPNRDWIGANTVIACEENSTCSIICAGKDRTNDDLCYKSNITCPIGSGDCTVECSGYEACRSSDIACGRSRDCLSCSGERSCISATLTFPGDGETVLNCSGYSSCQSASITCPANRNCTINCDDQYSCQNARVTCPSGDYSCNILCTDPLSCSSLRITNTHNVYLQCCGGETWCAGTSVVPTSTECQ